ncbi:hypothetical protein HID58_095529 [Brassica napus]|uniref:Uncharacterized protein n=1 Tax=Brassica napus TaxID=3708 RepID=A0ABQ7X3C8_BRANA|nr:hypothetical protein HID58_095529 [Brassica napus]
MPVGSEVFVIADLRSIRLPFEWLFSLRAWSNFSSGQAATIISFSHSKKRSIGGFLFLLISLSALSLTALSCLISDTGLKSANSSFLYS